MSRAAGRRIIPVVAIAFALGMAGSSFAVAAQAETKAFCDARMEFEHALLAGGHEAAHSHGGSSESHGHGFSAPAHGDDDHGGGDSHATGNTGNAKAVEDAAHALDEAAPATVQDDTATIHTAIADKGVEALQQRKVAAAKLRVDRFAVDSCGFESLKVALVDYGFRNLPEKPLAAGPVAFEITNAAPEEDHELIVLHVLDPDASPGAKKILGLSKKKLAKQTELMAAAFAAPHRTAIALADLEPGRYIVYCSVPIAGKHTPHWRNGMYAELEVA
jgi:hypothetical protein